MKVKSKAKGKGVTVTTYLPPPLMAYMDAVTAIEGGSLSGLLRAAVETCLTDLEWMRATHYRKKVALEGSDWEAAAVELRIEELRAKHGPAPLSRQPRLEWLVKGTDKEKPGQSNGAASPPAGSVAAKPAGGKALALTACLDGELAAWVDELAGREGVSVSALLRGIVELYLRDQGRERRLVANEKRARALGIAPEDVARLVKECRAEARAEKSA